MVESRVLHGRLQKGRKPARSALVTLLVVAGAFAAHVAMGDLAEFLVDDRREAVQGGGIAILPGFQ